jgi:hypothetical protein
MCTSLLDSDVEGYSLFLSSVDFTNYKINKRRHNLHDGYCWKPL